MALSHAVHAQRHRKNLEKNFLVSSKKAFDRKVMRIFTTFKIKSYFQLKSRPLALRAST